MSRKSRSFHQLLAYIDGPADKGMTLLHNFPAAVTKPQQVVTAFLENAEHLPRRRNGNVLYHEILSFSWLDQRRLTLSAIEDLTRRYLELRAPYALGYARAHFNTDCPHVHLILSANNVGSGDRLRLSRDAFSRMKRQLEDYQERHYPLLRHSRAQTPSERAPGMRRSRREDERRRRGAAGISRKEAVHQLVLEALSTASSGEECFRRLKAQGLLLYRRGQSVGIEEQLSGRRYRLRTLGLAEQFSAALRQWRASPRPRPDLQLGDRHQELPPERTLQR